MVTRRILATHGAGIDAVPLVPTSGISDGCRAGSYVQTVAGLTPAPSARYSDRTRSLHHQSVAVSQRQTSLCTDSRQLCRHSAPSTFTRPRTRDLLAGATHARASCTWPGARTLAVSPSGGGIVKGALCLGRCAEAAHTMVAGVLGDGGLLLLQLVDLNDSVSDVKAHRKRYASLLYYLVC